MSEDDEKEIKSLIEKELFKFNINEMPTVVDAIYNNVILGLSAYELGELLYRLGVNVTSSDDW